MHAREWNSNELVNPLSRLTDHAMFTLTDRLPIPLAQTSLKDESKSEVSKSFNLKHAETVEVRGKGALTLVQASPRSLAPDAFFGIRR